MQPGSINTLLIQTPKNTADKTTFGQSKYITLAGILLDCAIPIPSMLTRNSCVCKFHILYLTTCSLLSFVCESPRLGTIVYPPNWIKTQSPFNCCVNSLPHAGSSHWKAWWYRLVQPHHSIWAEGIVTPHLFFLFPLPLPAAKS